MRTMTLRELRDRLSAIIEENDRNPHFAGRNDLPVYVQARPATARGREQYTPVSYASSAMFGFDDARTGEPVECMTLVVHQAQATHHGRPKAAAAK